MYRIEHWNQLQSMIKGNILEKFYDDLIEYITKNTKKKQIIAKGTKFYRAREFDVNKNNIAFNSSFEGYNEEGSLAPNPEYVKEPGRVNKIGESVLYIAEDIYTAMAEKRPGKRQTISIAEVELKENIRVFEFEFLGNGGYQDTIKQIYHEMALEFYRTVNVDKENGYLVTQYIAKKIKELDFDGIKYSSSLSEKGMNLVIFNPKLAKANNSKTYLIQSVLYFAEKHHSIGDYERLLPKTIIEKFTPKEIEYFFNRMKQE